MCVPGLLFALFGDSLGKREARRAEVGLVAQEILEKLRSLQYGIGFAGSENATALAPTEKAQVVVQRVLEPNSFQIFHSLAPLHWHICLFVFERKKKGSLSR